MRPSDFKTLVRICVNDSSTYLCGRTAVHIALKEFPKEFHIALRRVFKPISRTCSVPSMVEQTDVAAGC